MKKAHEYVERALLSHLRILDECSGQSQPSQDLLTSIGSLLDRHHAGSPVANVEQRLEELAERLDRLEKAVSFSTLNSNRKKS